MHFHGEKMVLLDAKNVSKILSSWRVPLCIFILSMLFSNQALGGQGPFANSLGGEISVRMSAIATRIQAGDCVMLHIEIWNTGSKDFFIFKEFDSADNALSKFELKTSVYIA
jgi:hypothetical protein